MNNESKSVYYTFFYFNNALRCYNRMKKKNANTLHLPAVISKNIQQKPMINECKSVHITFFFFLFQQHTKMLQKNEKKSEHITFAGSYVEIYTTEAHDQGV